MGAGYHGGFGATKGSRVSNDAAPETVKLVKSGPEKNLVNMHLVQNLKMDIQM